MKRIYWITSLVIALLIFSLFIGKFNSPSIKADSPPSVIEFTLPDFSVQSLEGKDMVTIPEGVLLSVEGKPYVPYIQKRFTYSSGFSIQNITLTDRSQIKEGKGLKIPDFKYEIDRQDKVPNVPEIEQKDWFPDKDFEWEIDEKPDGSKMLLVSVYPFYYNRKTTEYKYVQHYKLNVVFIPSLIRIKSFAPEKDSFELTDPIIFSAEFSYQDNKPANLIATLLITDSDKKAVDSIQMLDLEGMEAENIKTKLEWLNTKKLTGSFYAKLEIRDYDGNLLDFKQTSLRIGRPNVVLTDFTVSSKQIKPGDTIQLFLKMQNKGPVNVNGRLLIKIEDNEKVIKRFEKEFKDVKPNDVVTIQESWKTAELVKGQKYTLFGTAYFESESSESMSLVLSTNTPPIAKFITIPPTGEAGKEIAFDASESSDPDGEIASYRWTFGDNLTGSGKTLSHRFNIGGAYKVKLTVVDKAGDETTIEKDLLIKSTTVEEPPTKIIIKLYIGQKSYSVNDVKKEMDTEPIIFEGRTLLPIRYVAEALGATVGWVQAEQKATIVFKETNIELWIGKNSAKVNGEFKLIDPSNPEVKPIVVPPGRTMLPIRFVAETLGCKVDWNPGTKEVMITYPK